MQKELFGFDLNLILLFIPVAYISYLFHEFGHWSMGEILGNDMAYPFLFFPFFSRFFSLAFGGFIKQDEAGISASLGIGTYTVAILVLGILLFLVWRGSKKFKFGFRENSFFFLISTLCILLVIGTYTIIK
jgi:hypothetical protein